ncbi:hypothetical protein QC761_0046940 [Podospora bellae-mahoneyi]|uniref:Beta-lactamase-related domain-containing protein n=1 Tax=Podospora bellae-mahoneyi TaxID=2093777 RepID=A0ABR0FVF7_9PEZI|nr:hypothetical protein QC761_0046940 [Podospora bellae-mahoneyi]
MQPINLLLFVSITTYIQVSWAAPNEHCPPLGPVLPPPTHASSSPAVASSVSTLQRFLDVYTAQFNHSAVAIGLNSIHEKDYILEYAYSPPNRNARGVQEVNSDSVFRIASVSKIFPVLGLLRLHGVSLDDPVTKYRAKPHLDYSLRRNYSWGSGITFVRYWCRHFWAVQMAWVFQTATGQCFLNDLANGLRSSSHFPQTLFTRTRDSPFSVCIRVCHKQVFQGLCAA